MTSGVGPEKGNNEWFRAATSKEVLTESAHDGESVSKACFGRKHISKIGR